MQWNLKGNSGFYSRAFLFSPEYQTWMLWMASLPFRTEGFQKDNLSCIITSICDLGQALVMHECFYRHAQDWRAAHRPTVSEETQSSLLWNAALINSFQITISWCVCVQWLSERLQLSLTPHSSNTSIGHIQYVLQLAQAAQGDVTYIPALTH